MARTQPKERIAEESQSGRASAGQDPQKRNQILEGAKRLFFANGFDTTSMDDVAVEAGVSKATLYVYFANKERLFSEVIGEERRKMVAWQFPIDHDDPNVAGVLGRLGRAVVKVVTTPYVVMSFRAVLGIGERIPHLGAAYYDEGPRVVISRLAEYLAGQVKRGRLDIDDTELAAAQFLDMAQTTMARPMLFSAADVPPPERVDQVVDSAVRVFMAAYGKQA